MKKYNVEKIVADVRKHLKWEFEDMLEAARVNQEYFRTPDGMPYPVIARLDEEGDVYTASYKDVDEPNDVSYAWSVWDLDPNEQIKTCEDVQKLLDNMDDWLEDQIEMIYDAIAYWQSQGV